MPKRKKGDQFPQDRGFETKDIECYLVEYHVDVDSKEFNDIVQRFLDDIKAHHGGYEGRAGLTRILDPGKDV